MAELKNYINNSTTDPTRLNLPLAPAGTFVARVTEIKDSFGVVRPVFNDPTKMETRDETRWTFACKDKSGQSFLVQTKAMRISGHEKSSLFQFLTGLAGAPPRLDEDYIQLKGSICQVTVAHQPAQSGHLYAQITNIAPAHAALVAYAPSLEEGESLYSWFEQQFHQRSLAHNSQGQAPQPQPTQIPPQVPTWPGWVPQAQPPPAPKAGPPAPPQASVAGQLGPFVLPVRNPIPRVSASPPAMEAPPSVNHLGAHLALPTPPPASGALGTGFNPDVREAMDVGF